MDKLTRAAVVMAGGAGERFWPLSRLRLPKQLLNINGRQSMLRDSIERIRTLVEPEHTFVVTGSDLAEAVCREVADLIPQANVIAEPSRKNTAPALALASATLDARLGRESVVAVLTADHAINDVEAFVADFDAAMTFATKEARLVTFGVTPNRPETGYGYVEVGGVVSGGRGLQERTLHRVASFREKPSPDTAQEFLQSGRFLWNSGMFVWRNRVFQEELATHLPTTAEALEPMRAAIEKGDQEALAVAFESTDGISIDYGVLERSKRVGVIRASFDWDDVGTWASVRRLLPADAEGNAVLGAGAAVKCENVLIYSPDAADNRQEKLVVAYGLEDVVIVNTPDAVLVVPADKVQGVKDVVAWLRSHGMREYL